MEKKYDFAKAKKIIKENLKKLDSASLGMHEDWFWTAGEIFANGKFTQKFTKETLINGIKGSRWATPTLQLVFNDGTDKMIECSLGQNEKGVKNPILYGVLSKPCQDNITPITEQ